jgi:hypothetical protein
MAAGYRTCRKPGCGYAIKDGKSRCLRCGTRVEERTYRPEAPPPRGRVNAEPTRKPGRPGLRHV